VREHDAVEVVEVLSTTAGNVSLPIDFKAPDETSHRSGDTPGRLCRIMVSHWVCRSTKAVEVSATLRGMTSLIGYARVSTAEQNPAH
jgi:hypothetical protein